MSTTTTDLINKTYDAQTEAAKKQLLASLEEGKATYGKNLTDAKVAYQTSRNKAYTDQAMSEQQRKESMANMGLSGAGGLSQTMELQNKNALLSTLGDVDKSENEYSNSVNTALAQLTTDYNSDLASALADIESNRNSALISDANADTELYYNLFQNGNITADQFTAKTGIKVQKARSGGGGGGGGGGGDLAALLASLGLTGADDTTTTTTRKNSGANAYTGYKNGGYYWKGKLTSAENYNKLKKSGTF
jgi:hypothetical protein